MGEGHATEEVIKVTQEDCRGTVCFSTITIREYPLTIGDNPGATEGPALAIDWDHLSEYEIDVDKYEQHRPRRRDLAQMRIEPCRRQKMLREAGFTKDEIRIRTKPVNIARRQRVRTVERLGLSPLQELTEKFSRQTVDVLTGKKRREKQFLKCLTAFRDMEKCDSIMVSNKSKASTPVTDRVSIAETADAEESVHGAPL